MINEILQRLHSDVRHADKHKLETVVTSASDIAAAASEIEHMRRDIRDCFDTLRKYVPETEPPWVDDVWIRLHRYV